MNTSKLDVLTNCICQDFTILSYSVHLYFLSMLNELTNHNRMIFTNISSQLQETLQLIFIRANVHRCTRKNIRRSYQYRETYSLNKYVNIIHTCQCTPLWLINIIPCQHSGELRTVLCIVYIFGSCTQNSNMLLIKIHSQIIRNLTTSTNDHTMRSFKIYNIHDTLKSQFVEIETVTHIIICTYGLRIIVNHYRTITFLANCIQSLNTTPVKFNRTTNTISTTT